MTNKNELSFRNYKNWQTLWIKYFNDTQKDDYYTLYESNDEIGLYRLKMLGIWVQVNIYFRYVNNEIKIIDCTLQSAMDDEYKKQTVTEKEALKICSDFDEFMNSLYIKE